MRLYVAMAPYKCIDKMLEFQVFVSHCLFTVEFLKLIISCMLVLLNCLLMLHFIL